MTWATAEMTGLNLGDKRLDHRAIRVLDQLAQGGESTPDAFRTKASLEGTYRLMDNPHTTPGALLAPHCEQTILRTAQQARVLLVHDSTEVDVTRPRRRLVGAGPLALPTRQGFFLHPLLAFTPEGLPLGLVAHFYWTRTQVDTHSTHTQKRQRAFPKPPLLAKHSENPQIRRLKAVNQPISSRQKDFFGLLETSLF